MTTTPKGDKPPTEPGWYLVYDKLTNRHFVVEARDGTFWFGYPNLRKLGDPERFAPFIWLSAPAPLAPALNSDEEKAWKAYEAVTPNLSERGTRRVDQHIGFYEGWNSHAAFAQWRDPAPYLDAKTGDRYSYEEAWPSMTNLALKRRTREQYDAEEGNRG